jgi:GNAT superfamily N-acetyltransferase
MQLTIRLLQSEDIEPIAAAFAAIGWNKPAAQYEGYLAEQTQGGRMVLVAFADGVFSGYINIVWVPDYPPFREAGIPELQDFNVLPHLRRQGIGSRLMDEAERVAGERSDLVGIGVGMTTDYGAAQQLYVLRGYIPDGRGLVYQNRYPAYGDIVRVDDDLVLHFTRQLQR